MMEMRNTRFWTVTLLFRAERVICQQVKVLSERYVFVEQRCVPPFICYSYIYKTLNPDL